MRTTVTSWVGLLILISACDSAPTDAPRSPGGIGDFAIGYPESSGSATGPVELVPLTACHLVGPQETLLLVRPVAPVDGHPRPRDCDIQWPYRSNYAIFPVDVVTSGSEHVAAGTRLDLHYSPDDFVEPLPGVLTGDLVVAVRQSRDSWWITEGVEVTTAATADQLAPVTDTGEDRNIDVQLPDTWFDLVDAVRDRQADYAAECMGTDEYNKWAETKAMDQAAFDSFVHTPVSPHWCEPGYEEPVLDMGRERTDGG